jgi:hypothetical protein
MGQYESWVFRPYKIPQKLYNYLFPVYKKYRLEQRQDIFYFHGSKLDYKDMLERSEFFRIDENIILS